MSTLGNQLNQAKTEAEDFIYTAALHRLNDTTQYMDSPILPDEVSYVANQRIHWQNALYLRSDILQTKLSGIARRHIES
jgi:hypothetical protein